MYLNNFAKFVVLSASLVLPAYASPSLPKITTSDKFKITQSATTVNADVLTSNDDGIPTVPHFFPTPADLIVNKTVPVGGIANLGWGFPSVGNATTSFDGSQKNITLLYTPAGGEEEFIFGIETGPDTEFCGAFPGFFLEANLPMDVVGTYRGRWIVEFGTSKERHAPVDPDSGCGPEPFDSHTVEFVREWKVFEEYY